MSGWLRSVGSGRLTWMRSNAISTAWMTRQIHPRIRPVQRKRKRGKANDPRGADTKSEEGRRRGRGAREDRGNDRALPRVGRAPPRAHLAHRAGAPTEVMVWHAGVREGRQDYLLLPSG